jgi:hypothetical protein
MNSLKIKDAEGSILSKYEHCPAFDKNQDGANIFLPGSMELKDLFSQCVLKKTNYSDYVILHEARE